MTSTDKVSNFYVSFPEKSSKHRHYPVKHLFQKPLGHNLDQFLEQYVLEIKLTQSKIYLEAFHKID